MLFSAGTLAADALQTKAFSNMPADFIKGADISTLLDAEKHGAKFFNHNNQPQDPIAILKADGVNYVRLRLWVDPKTPRVSATAAAITIWRRRWRWRSGQKRRV
jgi:arabinogalactan endo-1,4-beta-galactosidase